MSEGWDKGERVREEWEEGEVRLKGGCGKDGGRVVGG